MTAGVCKQKVLAAARVKVHQDAPYPIWLSPRHATHLS